MDGKPIEHLDIDFPNDRSEQMKSPTKSLPGSPAEKGQIKDKSQSKDYGAQGRWQKAEHDRFIEAIKKYGKEWKLVEQYIITRSGSQIRSHAQKFFNRIIKKYEIDKTQVISFIQNNYQSGDSSGSATPVKRKKLVTSDGQGVDISERKVTILPNVQASQVTSSNKINQTEAKAKKEKEEKDKEVKIDVQKREKMDNPGQSGSVDPSIKSGLDQQDDLNKATLSKK